ncbi:HpcH/HpaI aldolase/citrate lyase family protein [Paraburkholderia hospita]|jgi:citrate lyase subunit beta/citryl-CoA lyase|uniref:HpcH/HpaI aldolase/citrate lyase family protein n=1 Tax=Paraburkholderia hospita TaxID=169430 RepID=UPI000DEF15A0|nr:CoA ester lyase [Paraburkholderia hospita]AXF01763.1 CoA ester lyase [Paraburkholderia hospita]
MIARSYLFVPGDRPERFSKALATGAHQVVIDLEDAVSIDAKACARHQIATRLHAGLTDADRARIVVRVNAFGTPWHEEDVAMLRAARVMRVMVPKAEDPLQLADVAARSADGAGLVALVESVAGVVRLRQIAQCKGVARLAFGSFDFGVDAGIDGNGREFDYVRSQFVIESRFAGLPAPIDGVTLATDDAPLIAADVLDARRFGFGGKLCIHPKQVDAVNDGFAPSDAERAWAARVLAALEENPRGAISVDGRLVDKPIVDLAKRIQAA